MLKYWIDSITTKLKKASLLIPTIHFEASYQDHYAIYRQFINDFLNTTASTIQPVINFCKNTPTVIYWMNPKFWSFSNLGSKLKWGRVLAKIWASRMFVS